MLLALWAIGAHAVPIPPNLPVSGHLTGIQNNPQVVIVPWDTTQIVVAHRDSRLGYVQIALGRSTDGGATWTDTLLPPSAQRFNRQSTPTIAVGANGSVIMAHIDYATSIAGLDSSYLSTFISDDGGLNWSGPHTVMDTFGSYFENLPKLASDRTGGPFSGNIYIAWTRLSPFMSRVLSSQSGSDTLLWGAPAMPGPPGSAPCADSMGAGDHAQLAVGKDGAIYLFWRGNLQDPAPGCLTHYTMTFSKSLDGGNTWSNPRFMGTVTGGGSIDGGVSVYTRPLVAADISNGPHGGTIYVAYMDRWGTTDTDIYCLRSNDTAHSWKPPVRINDDPVGPDVDQFHNALACNDEGVLVSVWYDQRLDPANTLFDLFAAYSYDGGATWTANHRVSSSSINPALLGGSLGEYIGLSCVDDKVVAVWTDTREGDQDIWSARWSLPLTEPRQFTESGASLSCGGSLRWATAWKETQDRYRLQVATSPQFSVNDIVLDGVVETNSFALPAGLPAGTLHWRIKAYRVAGGTLNDSTDYSENRSVNYGQCPCTCVCFHDPVCDSTTNLPDIVATVDVAFGGTPAEDDPEASCPYIRTDIDCDSVTDVLDVVLLVNLVYRQVVLTPDLCGLCE